MCVVSMIGDFYGQRFQQPEYIRLMALPEISRFEFDQLKKEIQDMKELLKRALEYDKRNNEPHCETEEKIALLEKFAQLVGVDLNDILTS